MKLTVLLALTLCVAVVTISVVAFVIRSSESYPAGTQSLQYVFTIADTPGVDTATDVFRLGQITPGGSSWRTLGLGTGVSSRTSEDQGAPKVVVIARGAGSEWLVIEPALTALPAEVNISLRPGPTAPLGEYRGTLYVIPYEG